MIHTLKEQRDHLRTVARLTTAENDLIDNMINLTINEINDFHTWTFNRRKTTFDTVASTEEYVLPRDLDMVGVLRQVDTPIKLTHLPDEVFYRLVPDPTDDSGNPRWYRLWENEGVETRLAEADTVDVVSDSTSDGSTFYVTVSGYNANGIKVSENYNLNGTTTVAGTISFKANMPIMVSKSGTTTGNITVTENSGGTTLVILGKQERSPRFKVVGLYPIPSGAITMYLEYFTRIKELIYDTDTPSIPNEWHWLVREGSLAKIYQFQNKLADYSAAESRYIQGLKRMKSKDVLNLDYIPVVNPRGARLTFWDTYLWDNTITTV